MIHPPFTVSRPGNTLQSTGLQNLGPQDIKAVAASVALGQFDHSIEALGISGCIAMGEVVENRVSVVLDGQSEWQESIRDFRCDLCEPCKVLLQSGFLCWGFVDAVKGFLEVIGRFQRWEVLEPGFKDQGFALGEVVRASEQQEPIVHQGFPLLVCQAFPYLLTNGFQTSRKQLEDVELVHYQTGMRQDLVYCIMVTGPHVRTDDGNMFFRALWQALQVADHGWFVPVSKHVNNLAVFDIGDNAAILIEQVQFINPDAGAFERGCAIEVLDGLSKDEPDKFFVNAYIIGDAGKGSSLRLLSDVEYQALCHEVMFIHVGERFKESPVTVSTSVPLPYHLDTRSLPSNGDVHEQLMLDLMAVESRTGAMWATQRHRFLLSDDLIIVFMLSNGQDTPMGPAKNIQGQFSQMGLLPIEFYTRRVKVVAREGRLPVQSTHFSEFWTEYYVACFHVIFRIAININPVLHLWACLDAPDGVLPHFEGLAVLGGKEQLSV